MNGLKTLSCVQLRTTQHDLHIHHCLFRSTDHNHVNSTKLNLYSLTFTINGDKLVTVSIFARLYLSHYSSELILIWPSSYYQLT